MDKVRSSLHERLLEMGKIGRGKFAVVSGLGILVIGIRIRTEAESRFLILEHLAFARILFQDHGRITSVSLSAN